MKTLLEIGRNARQVKNAVGLLGANAKNQGLANIADALEQQYEEIIRANAVDIENGRKNGSIQILAAFSFVIIPPVPFSLPAPPAARSSSGVMRFT